MSRTPGGDGSARIVAVLAALSGLSAAVIGVHPTGSTPIDFVLVVATASSVTWAAATAPWWLVGGVALLACGTAASALLVLVGLAAVAVASLVGGAGRDVPWAQSLAALLAIQVLGRCDLDVFFGSSALLSCGALLVLFVWGVMGRPQIVRRRVWSAVGAVGAFAALATVGFVVAGLHARGPLQDGMRQARAGLSELEIGDMAAAQASFAASAESFRKVDSSLSAVWAQGARLVPVVAQHRQSVSSLAAAAAEATSVAAGALNRIDPDTVRAINGRIDIAAVRNLEAPFAQLALTIEHLQEAVHRSQSSWLAGGLQTRLTTLDVELAGRQRSVENALSAVRVAPQMLGEGEVRRYFVAFVTPAEARGLGGFMGNWAELTITDGRIEMTQFGRLADLEDAMRDQRPVLTGLDDFVQHWGRFGFADQPGGAVDDEVWSIVTMAPDFPTVAQVISQLYPQSGGQPIDGVFLLDSEAIAALLNFTGPLEFEGVNRMLTADNAAEFINKDQYLLPGHAERVNLLEQIARVTVGKLLSTSLPPPAELARVFAPLVAEGRLMAWAANPDEQAFLEQVNMDDSFPALAQADGIAVTVDNANGNKIDAFLDMSVDYEVIDPGTDGVRTTRATVTLTNTAPSVGLPSYVIGNEIGIPDGTNRTWLSVYTALPMISVQVDGKPDGMQTSTAFGWQVAARFVDIPAGATVTVVLTLQGSLPEADVLPFVQRVQALVQVPVYRFESMLPA